MKNGLHSPAFAALLSISASVADAALFNGPIKTDYGLVQGYPAFNSSPAGNLTNWKDITVWKNIPFAATTGGQNRWKEPHTSISLISARRQAVNDAVHGLVQLNLSCSGDACR